MQTIVIAGCGYLGMKVAGKLIRAHHYQPDKILALVSSQNSAQSCRQKGLSCLAFDLDNVSEAAQPAQLCKAFNKNRPVVFYFIPPPPQGEKDTRAEQFINVLSSLSRSHDTELPAKIVLVSTTGVYGHCHGQWVDETTPLNPQADRAKRRVDAEQQFQAYCDSLQIPLVILRVAGIYAADKLPEQRLRALKPIVREEDSPYSNRIHADDLVAICIKAAENASITGIYNCADGHPTTMYDYFMRVAHFCQLAEPPVISLAQARTRLSAGMLSYMDESRRIDNNKLLKDFNIRLQYPSIDQGLASK